MTLTEDISNARHILLKEYLDVTRIEMNKEKARQAAKEAGIDLPDDWNPYLGEYVGKLFGIPVYINKSVDDFIMIGGRKK